jgi:hypothetical protein
MGDSVKNLYTWAAATIQAVFIAAALYWIQHPADIGTAIAALAIAGVFMAVRAEQFTLTEKIVWVLVASLLFYAEIRSIKQDREAHDRQQAWIREDEDLARDQERRQFAELLRQGRLLFSQEQTLSTKTNNQISGGPSYAVVVPLLSLPIKEPNTFALAVFIGTKREQNNLSEARVYIEQESGPNGGTKAGATEILTGNSHGPVWTGDIFATSGMTLPSQVSITPSLAGVTTYFINIFARNKPTTETLQVRKNLQSGEWEQSYKIERVLRYGGPGKKDVVETLEVTPWRRAQFLGSK